MAQICRTCFQMVAAPNFFEVTNDEKSSQIKIEVLLCIPEIDLNLLGNPIICTSCMNALNASYKFKKQCLYAEERIRSYLSTRNGNVGIKIYEIYKASTASISNITLPEPRRNYIDDLNDLLDDALGSDDFAPRPIPSTEIKKEIVMPNEETDVISKPKPATRQKKVIAPTTTLLKCKICQFEAHSLKLFALHSKKHKPKAFNCSICSFKTAYKPTLQHHMDRHKTHEIIKCQYCDYKSTSQNTMKKHYSSVHAGKNSNVEQIKNTLDSKKRHVCPVCSKRFDRPSVLGKHLNKDHHRKLNFCRKCSIVFKTEGLLNDHVKKIHDITDAKRYACEQCSFVTNNRHKFAGHHTGH